jgi:hypothetical protein
MDDELKIGKYKHFKGKLYKVLGIARNSENPEQEYVFYLALYDDEKFGNNALWIRSKQMFLEKVNINGKEVSRFEYIGE